MLYGFAATYMMNVPQGFPSKDMTKLEDYGFVASRPRGEYHANNQQMAKLLHKAIGLGGKKAAPMVSQPTLCNDVLCHHGKACIVCQTTAVCKNFDLASLSRFSFYSLKSHSPVSCLRSESCQVKEQTKERLRSVVRVCAGSLSGI